MRFTTNPDTSLIVQSPLWLTVGAWILITTLLAWPITAHVTSAPWPWTGDNYAAFIKAFSFPLGVLALLAPALILVARNHRSAQAVRQILLASSQNNFVNYYKHHEEFDLHIRRKITDAVRSGKLTDIDGLHALAFPNCRRFGDYSFGEDFICGIDEMAANVISRLKAIEKGGDIREIIAPFNSLLHKDLQRVRLGFVQPEVDTAYIDRKPNGTETKLRVPVSTGHLLMMIMTSQITIFSVLKYNEEWHPTGNFLKLWSIVNSSVQSVPADQYHNAPKSIIFRQ